MQESLTQDSAIENTVKHLEEAIDFLPPTVRLSKTLSPGDGLSGGDNAVCDEFNPETSPVYFSSDFWVVGIPNGQVEEYFNKVARAWQGKGWQLSGWEQTGTKTVIAKLSDGYKLIAQLAPIGQLSLAGESPCFPKANSPDNPVSPSEIAHP